ncbi:Hypothetical protein FKW44_012171 [Caligus rogercresseyi]|uniref:Uncharacterized protein n=1 Tax=Caligus rogercresseyi TaxID=217165 RepID=A0A7T8KA70_CALRO|nr:Hypothetical protein FKW44_012171 [Caligus rogercresseyi]
MGDLSDDSIDIIKAKELLNMEELPAQLAAITTNFTGLVLCKEDTRGVQL